MAGIRHARPRSTLTLVLFGFGVVALPLIVALAGVGIYMDRLGRLGQTTVYNAARAVQYVSSLSETLVTMERGARQYLVLGDQALFDVYAKSHENFQSVLRELQQLSPEPPYQSTLREITRLERELFERLSAEQGAPNLSQEVVVGHITQLRDLAETIREASNRVIDEEVARMQSTAGMAQQMVLWIGAALLPLTALSTGLFTVLISRPVRQVDRAIRQLGDGDFEPEIRVSGPDDLRALGERLDWLRRRLLELESQKTRFLRHVSHELKTPLTSIRESAALLKDEAVGPLNDEQREIAAILGNNARQLQALIEDLIDFSHTQDRRPPLYPTLLDLDALINSVLENHKAALRGKDLQVESRLCACPVRADGDKLRTVADNLLSNAIKFSPNGGCITIGVGCNEQTAWFDVADQGPDIAADERDRIFDAFYQGDLQPSGYVKGSGLGLSIAREYVHAHAGTIEFLETAASSGAYIRVTLPTGGTRIKGGEHDPS